MSDDGTSADDTGPCPPPVDSARLRLAQDVLAQAYEQARRWGYAPGSPQMDRLRQAEAHYQRVMEGRPDAGDD